MDDAAHGDADPDRYVTVEDGPEAELRVRGSRFVGQAFATSSESRAREARDALRTRYHDATHHCLGLRIGPPEHAVERSDDDGEPSGTGGAPIVAALRRADVHDAAVVVTRWYGGTKLGTGGLARAYGDAARLAVDAAARREVLRLRTIRVTCAWDDLGAVEALLARESGSTARVEREFSDDPGLVVRVLRSRADGLARMITDATSGRAAVECEEDGTR